MEKLIEDYLRFRPRMNWPALILTILTNPPFLAVACYRLAHTCFVNGRDRAAWLISLFARYLTGINLEYRAEIGGGLRIAHGFGAVIGNGASIGRNFTIGPGAVIGGNFNRRRIQDNGEAAEYPRIGDQVHVAAGAKVLGPIVVGDFVIIGANAVVTQDVPSYSKVAAGQAVIKPIAAPGEEFDRFFPRSRLK